MKYFLSNICKIDKKKPFPNLGKGWVSKAWLALKEIYGFTTLVLGAWLALRVPQLKNLNDFLPIV